MGDLLSDYFDEMEELQHQESEALILVLFSLAGAINGNIVDFVRVWEQVDFLKSALERRKDLLQAAKAANKGGRAGKTGKRGGPIE